jgi:hypothetical protein
MSASRASGRAQPAELRKGASGALLVKASCLLSRRRLVCLSMTLVSAAVGGTGRRHSGLPRAAAPRSTFRPVLDRPSDSGLEQNMRAARPSRLPGGVGDRGCKDSEQDDAGNTEKELHGGDVCVVPEGPGAKRRQTLGWIVGNARTLGRRRRRLWSTVAAPRLPPRPGVWSSAAAMMSLGVAADDGSVLAGQAQESLPVGGSPHRCPPLPLAMVQPQGKPRQVLLARDRALGVLRVAGFEPGPDQNLLLW